VHPLIPGIDNPAGTPPPRTGPVLPPPEGTAPQADTVPVGAAAAARASSSSHSPWTPVAGRSSAANASPPTGVAAELSAPSWAAAALADVSRSRVSPRGIGLPGSPAAPSGASGSGASALGGISITWLAVLMALAGLVALLFERLTLAPAAWRSTARIALLERPG
jgi:hypothetical protein